MKKKIVDEATVIIMDEYDDDMEQSWTTDPSRVMSLGIKLGDACWALLGSSKVSPMLRQELNRIKLPDYGHVKIGSSGSDSAPIRIEDGQLVRVRLWITSEDPK